MEIFYSDSISGNLVRLDQEESQHCAKVLRRKVGDSIDVIDGEGNLYRCSITSDSPKSVEAVANEVLRDWHSHPYKLTLAVCPTKNNDRYEWFAEKATEFGADVFVPVIGTHSERKVFKPERLRRVVLSAVKQSLKARLPQVAEPVTVKDFIKETAGTDAVKMIAYCFEDGALPRRSVKEVLASGTSDNIIVLIGPEGDFSREEALLAVESGYVPVHIGQSRLRTETAGVAAASAVYFEYM